MVIDFTNTTFVGIVCAAMLCGGCGRTLDTTDTVAAPVTEVTTVHPRCGHIAVTTVWQAVTTYQSKTAVTAPVAAYVVRTAVHIGCSVRRGDTLFELESKEQHALQNTATERIAICATCDGIVADAVQPAGTYLSEETLLCTVADAQSLVFEIEVPFEQTSLLHRGSRCMFTLPDGTELHGMVGETLIGVNAQNQTQRFAARVATQRFLPEGLIARAAVAQRGEAGWLLPRTAVQSDVTMSEFWIMVAQNDSTACRLPVTVGNSDASDIEILTPRLADTMRVITDGGYALEEKARIKIADR